jgi:hypothetical protein
LGC